jgi:hypothetical protein
MIGPIFKRTTEKTSQFSLKNRAGENKNNIILALSFAFVKNSSIYTFNIER